MRKNKKPVRFTGQHFTIDKMLITDMIKIAKIDDNVLVLDIGAGKGFLTVHLTRQNNSVVAIEIDKFLLSILRKKFVDNPNVKIIGSDFRNYSIPKSNFKVVSNIPYGITSDILKKLMYQNLEYFLGGSLILQLETAKKFFTKKIFNPYIVFYHTFFDLKLMYEIAQQSFIPPPKIKSALLKIEKKETTIGFKLKDKYLSFLRFLLQEPNLNAKTALKKIFRKSQLRKISEKYGINTNCPIVNLTINQWVACFQEMLVYVLEKHHPV